MWARDWLLVGDWLEGAAVKELAAGPGNGLTDAWGSRLDAARGRRIAVHQLPKLVPGLSWQPPLAGGGEHLSKLLPYRDAR